MSSSFSLFVTIFVQKITQSFTEKGTEKKRVWPVFLFLLLSFTLNAQYILKEDPEHNAYNPKVGANCRHYASPFIRSGYIIGQADNSVFMKPGSSFNYTIGGRYKYKINNTISVGIEAAYNLDNYYINPNGNYADSVFMVGPQAHKYESFIAEGWQGNANLRINFDPQRAIHSLGKYLDIGGGAEKVFYNEYKASENRQSTSFKNRAYTAKWQYHTYIRIGNGSVALGLDCRVSNAFVKQYNLPEPPRYSISLEMDPYAVLKGLGVFP